MIKILTLLILAVIVVQHTHTAEGLGLLAGLARADRLELLAGAVVHARLLASGLFFEFLQVWLVGAAGGQGYAD